MQSCLYTGWVRHRRREPVEHSFRSRLYLVYLDLSELDRVFAGRWFWSCHRPAWARFRRDDHFGDPRQPLDEAARDLAAAETGIRPDGPVRLLTHLRYAGFVFNPVSFFFCYGSQDDSRPSHVIAEVNNTPWGQRHCYVLTGDHFARTSSRKLVPKRFHVSPFMEMNMDYRWSISAPGERLNIAIQNRRAEGVPFTVTMHLKRLPITTGNLARVLLGYPLMTAQVVAQIYWQAFRLWWKGSPFIPHPDKGRPHGNASPPMTPLPSTVTRGPK